MGYKRAVLDFITMDLNEMRAKDFLSNELEWQKTGVNSVNNKNGWVSREECPLCKSQKKTYQFSKLGFNLFECDDCKTAFFDRIPKVANDVYSSEAATQIAKTAYLSNKDYRRIRFAKERVAMLERYSGKPVSQTKILDVGCGTGWFLEYAQEQGATCYGVELGTDLASYTAEYLGITVWNCDLTELDTTERFDVITMFDLIEHVEDPIQLINSAQKLLTTEGVIIVFTPHYDSVAIQIAKEHSNLVAPAEHLSYFTKQSVLKLAEMCNMQIKFYTTKGIDVGDLKAFYDYLGQHDKADYLAEMYDILQPVIDKSESGNHMRFVLGNIID